MRRVRLPAFALAIPAWAWLVIFFVLPVAVVFWYSFGYKPGMLGSHANDILSFDRYLEALTPTFFDTFLNTLLVGTSYFSGQVAPALGVFYDWGGAVVAQPQVTLIRDPFRFTISYSYLYATTLKGGSGISLLRDRDNVLFQLEYVI